MPIQGTEYMGDWGKKVPVNDLSHLSQTNDRARDGVGAHVTDDIQGQPVCVHTRFDDKGNSLGTGFGER